MFYLTTHSTHCIYGRERERNVLFNDALNTLYLREREREMFYLTTHSTHFIYGYMASRHMVKDHSDGEKERKPAAAT